MFISTSSVSAPSVVISYGDNTLDWGTVNISSYGVEGLQVLPAAMAEVMPQIETLEVLIESWGYYSSQVVEEDSLEIGGIPVNLYIQGDGTVLVFVDDSMDIEGKLTPQQGMVVMKRFRRFVDNYLRVNPGKVLKCTPNELDGRADYRLKVFKWAGFIERSNGVLYRY